MNFNPAPSRAHCNQSFARAAALLASAMGAVALCGWWLNVEILKRVVPGSAPLKPNIAAGFVLSGLSLAILSQRGRPNRALLRQGEEQFPPSERSDFSFAQILACATSAIVITVGLLTLAEHFFGWNAGIDDLLIHKVSSHSTDAHPGRIMPATAFCFVLAGCTILAQSRLVPARLQYPFVGGFASALLLFGVVGAGAFILEKLVGSQWSLLGMNLSGGSGTFGFILLGIAALALLRSQSASFWSLDALTTSGFVLGVVLMVVTAAAGLTVTRRMLEMNHSVIHRQEVLKEIQGSMTGVTELTSSERVYTIVGAERLLNQRERIKAGLAEDLRDIRRLTADNPRQRARLDHLTPLIQRRIEWEERMITTRRANGFSSAAQLSATGIGIELSERIQSDFKVLQDEEYRLLQEDQEGADLASTATFLLLPLGVFVSLTVSSLGLFFLNSGVAERAKTEQTLREREAQLNTIVENLDEGIIVSDLEGHLLHWNPSALKLHGYAQHDQDRRRFPELTDTFELSDLGGRIVPVEDWPLGRILRGQTLRNLELQIHRIGTERTRTFSYGGALVHDGNGKPLMAIVTIDDITERKAAEIQLRASLKEVSDLKTALDEHAIVAITDPQGKITYVNDKFCMISKYSREELLGQDHRVINSGYHSKEFIRSLWTTIGQGQVWHGEIKNKAKDGSAYWVDTTIVPFLNEQGKPRQYVAVRTDITARKQAESGIRRLNIELEGRVQQRTAELEAANKELEAFSYSVSHDLRAPLRAVDGFSQAVLEDYGAQLPEEGRHYLETIRGGAQRMGNLIDDLLTFSRLSRLPLNKQTVRPKQLVSEALQELDAQCDRRNIDLRIGELPECEGDPALLKQVWVNLLSNSLKYTRKREHAVVEIGSTRDKGEPVYFVTDNGTGFDMQYANKLFGVFQRLHRSDEFEGTGVGLAIVQRIVHRHGGRVWANATPDRGASFYFTLQNGKEI